MSIASTDFLKKYLLKEFGLVFEKKKRKKRLEKMIISTLLISK